MRKSDKRIPWSGTLPLPGETSEELARKAATPMNSSEDQIFRPLTCKPWERLGLARGLLLGNNDFIRIYVFILINRLQDPGLRATLNLARTQDLGLSGAVSELRWKTTKCQASPWHQKLWKLVQRYPTVWKNDPAISRIPTSVKSRFYLFSDPQPSNSRPDNRQKERTASIDGKRLYFSSNVPKQYPPWTPRSRSHAQKPAGHFRLSGY